MCVIGLDHHCPWVGKCIGKENIWAFYGFLATTFVHMIIAFLATASINIAELQHP